MSITDYTSLCAAVAEWLNRGDLTARIPTFIALAEAKLRRDVRAVSACMDVAVTAGTASVALPSDCGELRSVAWVQASGRTIPLDVGTREQAWADDPFRALGIPQRATILSSVGTPLLILAPKPASAGVLSLDYYRTVPALSSTVPGNWLLTRGPDAYLYGALAEASAFLVEDERVPLWLSQYRASVDAINAEAERAEFMASLRPVMTPYTF